MQTILQDLRYGFRGLRKSPGFTAVAVLVLALGIGANTAIFTVVNAVLLRPLPFDHPEQLMQLYHVPPQTSFPGMTTFSLSPANFLDWEKASHSFEAMSAYGFGGYTLTGSGRPEAVRVIRTSKGFFAVLHGQPLLGRVFLDSEDQPGQDHEVVLNYDFWRTHFGANPSIVGHTIQLNGEPFTVVGVMPEGFQFPIFSDPTYSPQMWKPMGWTAAERAVRDNHNYLAIGRLRPGITLDQARAELNTIADQLARQYPKDDKGWGATAIPVRQDLVVDVRPALLILLGAVALVLLIACANVANLVLAKTLSRRKEVAIRSALGASRRRLLQQVIAETVLLALAGGALGLILAHYGTMLIVRFLAQQLPLANAIRVDGSVLGFTFGIALLSGLMAGLLPAIRLTREDVSDALKQGLGRTDASSSRSRTRGALVVVEVALSLMLLIGAGLLIRSLWALHSVSPGFDADHVVTMDLMIPQSKFATPSQMSDFYNQILDRVRAVPGVRSAGLNDAMPLSGFGSHQPIQIEGRPVVPMADQPEVDVRVVTPGYLSAMRIPLLRGRDLSDSDAAGRPGAILISQSMAREFWPNQDPVGKHLALYFFPGVSREVVGIVGDVKMDALSQTRPTTAVYMPMAQLSATSGRPWHSPSLTLAVRTTTSPLSAVTALSNAVHSVDADVPLLNIKTMQEWVDESIAPQRFTMLLLASFAGLALLLAGIGIYSVLSYVVRRRMREIGIRMALGAQLQDVLRLVLLEGMKPTAIGVVIGLLGALALGRVLSSVVFGVSPRDIATFSVVPLVLAAVGMLASVIPAIRATRVDPMKILREE